MLTVCNSNKAAYNFGRAMMLHAVNMSNDTDFNNFSRVGNKLMNIGESGYPKTIYDFTPDDMEFINRALTLLQIAA